MTTREKLLQLMKDPNSIETALQIASTEDEELYKASKDILKACEREYRFSSVLQGDWLFCRRHYIGTEGYKRIKNLDIEHYVKVLNIELGVEEDKDSVALIINQSDLNK